MEGYEPSTYGERWAEIYDASFEDLDPATAAAFLADLAGPGPALELAIGTGRVALPLRELGVSVHGIDISEEMIARLRAKPGGNDIPVTIGNFAEVGVEGLYPLIYVVFNTLFALTTQEQQVRCFRNVAKHLSSGGSFVTEAFVPDLARFDRGQRTQTNSLAADEVSVEVSRHDAVTQQVASQHLVVEDGKIQMYPVFIRYAFPSELDLMAEIAGLKLKARYADWDKRPFTAASTSHVSVYEHP